MNEVMTLKEVCKKVGVTRRAIQGYEEAGLVSPTGKNKYGHLLYGKTEQEHIEKIKLYQDLGFSIKEIKILVKLSEAQLKEALMKQVEKLRDKQRNITSLIVKAEAIIEKLDILQEKVDC